MTNDHNADERKRFADIRAVIDRVLWTSQATEQNKRILAEAIADALVAQPAPVVPEGWVITPTDGGDGFIVSTPRVNGIARHTAVSPDDNDPAHKLLWHVLAATPAPVQHHDDAAVDRFAEAMKAKLAKSRAKGRGGWEDKSLCSAEYLSELLRGHVDKGDPVDVANFCMMLQQRGEGIAAPAQGQQVECQECGRLRGDFEELAERYGKLQAGEDSLLAKVVTERDQALAELSALKAQQEPVAWRVTGAGGLTVTPEYPKWAEDDSRLLIESLYTAPQPAPDQDVAGWISVNERLPNCGHAVLAYYLNRQGMGRRIRAEYVTRWTVEAEMFADPDTECVEYSELEDAYYVTEGWYELIDNWDEYARIAVNEGVVTNWMPLPAAPAHDKQSGGEV